MKEKKQLMVMTSFGFPVPYEAVKSHLSKELTDVIDAEKDKILGAIENVVPMCVGYYIKSLAEKKGWEPKKMAGYLQSMWEINPAAAFSTLLREIAIELDKQYEDHINECKELYVISLMDGRIHKVPRAYIKNFRNFSAFRTVEDAKVACRILRDDLKEMFSGRK